MQVALRQQLQPAAVRGPELGARPHVARPVAAGAAAAAAPGAAPAAPTAPAAPAAAAAARLRLPRLLDGSPGGLQGSAGRWQ